MPKSDEKRTNYEDNKLNVAFTAAFYTKVALPGQLYVNSPHTGFHRNQSNGSMIIRLSVFRRHSRR